jgi:Fe/S biogenesis protein NfuA
MIIVSRSPEGSWKELLPALEQMIRDHYAGRTTAKIRTSSPTDQLLWDKVWTVLDEKINPALQSHGGHIELREVQGNSIWVEMGGGCQGCGMAAVTMKQGVEQSIREAIPEIEHIIDVTEHSQGSNPYY